MAGFLNRMINGNPNKPEFTPDMLPKNRFELFWEMLKLNFLNLIKANLSYALFTIPMWIWIWMHFQVLISFLDGGAAEGEAIQQFLLYFYIFLLGMIPCLAISGLAKPALKYLTRNWARDDHAYPWADFWYAFKQNWKQGLIMGICNGLLFAMGGFVLYFYYIMSANNSIFAVLQVLLVVVCAIYIMMNLYIWPMLVTYDMKLKDVLRNSMIIAIGRLPFSVLYCVITLVPMVICLFFPIACLYYFVIGYALHSFINASYTNGAFDKYINSRIEGAEVNKGLRPVEEDEYEYVDIDDIDDIDDEDDDNED